MKKILASLLTQILLFVSLIVLGSTKLYGQAATGWSGNGPDGFWSTALNWTNGVPDSNTNSQSARARILNFGPPGNAHPASTNDLNNVSGHRIFFNNGASAYTLYLKTGTGGTILNDFGNNQPQIQNDSTNVQTIDMSFKMQAKGVSTAANQAANINPTVGDLVFTTNCTITLITNTQLRFFSSAGRTVSFYGPLVMSPGVTNNCVLGTAGSVGLGATVIFFNTNGCTNIVINCGTVRLGTNNVTSAPIIMGDTALNLAPANLQLDNGLSNNSPILTQAGSTNSRTVGNTAIGTGTALFSGPVTLGTNLNTIANPAGLLEFDGNIDFQNPAGTGPRTLLVSGSGNTIFAGSFVNASTGSSVFTKTNSGVVTITGTGNASRILYNLGGGAISITNAGAIGLPTGANYPDKFNFTASATLSVTNSFTLGRNAGALDNAGFRIAGGAAGTFDVAAGSTLTIDGPIIDLPATGSGSLTKISPGTLVLQQSNTYSGITTVSNGVLSLSGSGSLNNSSAIVIGESATFGLSGLSSTLALGAAQTLKNINGTANLVGNLNVNAGSLVLNYTNGTPSFQISGGQLNFNNNAVTVTVAGSALPAGSYKLVAAGAGGSVSGTVTGSSLTVNGAGFASGAQVSLKVLGGELYLVVNHAPTAATLNLTRNAGIPVLKIFFADLAANWSDPENDAIAIVSVGNSTNGVVLTTNGAFLVYSNLNNVDDRFTYVISDAQGATTNGTVTITVNQTISGQVQTFGVISGSPTLSFAGIPGYSYTVQRSTNLPVWVTIWTTNAPAHGVFSFTDDFNDLGFVAPASAFYRLNW